MCPAGTQKAQNWQKRNRLSRKLFVTFAFLFALFVFLPFTPGVPAYCP